MAAASVQAPQAALVQQEDVKVPNPHQKADMSLVSILQQADFADQPFLAPPAEQPARARVDYAKSQRPLQVLIQVLAHCMFVRAGCCCNVNAVCYSASSLGFSKLNMLLVVVQNITPCKATPCCLHCRL